MGVGGNTYQVEVVNARIDMDNNTAVTRMVRMDPKTMRITMMRMTTMMKMITMMMVKTMMIKITTQLTVENQTLGKRRMME